ncbi:His/Gly/Thr/Pro-type tRNA ligase C-terminal domain-containing protein, partial [Bacillus sp. SIMBA_074]
AQMQKIPYMLVVGDNEAKEGSVNVRKYGEQKSETIAFEDFVAAIKAEVSR